MSRPTSEHPVGGGVLSVVRVARPQTRVWRAYAALAPKAALLARARQRRRRFPAIPVAVTGSVGKSTTTYLLAAGLATIGSVARAPYRNRARGLVQAVGSLEPDMSFLVQETGASGPGSLDELLWVLEPRVAVVTTIRPEHTTAFGDLDAIAREKQKLVAVLPPDGIAVLNADDLRVRTMAGLHPGRVVLAGQADDADVRLLDERVTPEFRYAATISAAGRELEVETRLVGAHWGPAVALALAGAVALGGDPRRVANAIATAEPARERLEPVVMPTGGTLLVDTRKATPATLAPALEALAGVPAIRRIAVVGSLAYFDAPEEQAYADAARAARAVADEVVLYGPNAHLGASALPGDAHVTAFTSISELAGWIREVTGPGDVVLVKGTYPYDHLYRIVLQFTHDVQCWSDDCRRRLDCLRCPRLGPPRSAATAEESTSA